MHAEGENNETTVFLYQDACESEKKVVKICKNTVFLHQNVCQEEKKSLRRRIFVSKCMCKHEEVAKIA